MLNLRESIPQQQPILEENKPAVKIASNKYPYLTDLRMFSRSIDPIVTKYLPIETVKTAEEIHDTNTSNEKAVFKRLIEERIQSLWS